MKDYEVCSAIIEANGANHQLAVAVEELVELSKELTKSIRGKIDKMKVAEEIADVTICLLQLELMFGISKKEVDVFKKHKLERLEVFYIDGGRK